MLGHAPFGRYAIGETASVLPVVVAEVGAFTLSGQTALSHRTRKAAAGTFTLTGRAASRRITMVAATGAVTLSGQAANLKRGLRLVAAPTFSTYGYHPLFAALGQLPLGGAITGSTSITTFVLSGNDSVGERFTGLNAESGIFVFTGVAAGLVPTIYPPKIRMFPSVGRGVLGRSAGGGAQIRTSVGGGMRARAFGG